MTSQASTWTPELATLDQPDSAQAVESSSKRFLVLQLVTELVIIVAVGFLYAGTPLLDFNSTTLQQTSEQNEASTLPILTWIGVQKYHVVPLWNPYMLTGFPYSGDFVSNLYHPVATIPVLLWGGVNGFKVSSFLSFILAGIGQLALGYALGLRSPMRLWSALLFMLSGGLGLYWRLGWYQLLIGMAWFPWSYAAFIWALHNHRLASLALAALAIALVLTSAGGYYYLYLFVSLVPLTLVLLALAPAAQRRTMLICALAIGVLSIALVSVFAWPAVDAYQYTVRETLGDAQQTASQPIPYALFQYVVADGSWFNSQTLGQSAGFTWFYIGYLPLAALIFVPLAFNGSRNRRIALIALITLTALFLLWHANRYTFVGEIYKAIPFLYTFRFPGRLLVVAACPLIALGGFGLQAVWEWLERVLASLEIRLMAGNQQAVGLPGLPLAWLAELGLFVIMAFSVRDVFNINKPFVFTNNTTRDKTAVEALTWLKQHDPSLYYISVGDWRIWWWWTATAYEFEQPMINFAYNRHLKNYEAQQTDSSIIRARPKYVFPWPDGNVAGATPLQKFGSVTVYQMPDALPFAFTINPARLNVNKPVTAAEVQALDPHWLNPNQLQVRATANSAVQQLVALVSYYPGWQVYADDQTVPLTPANEYLGVKLLEGTHTYTFSFEPRKFYVGAVVSLASLAIALLMIVGTLLHLAQEAILRRRQHTQQAWRPRTAPSPEGVSI